jgi:subtilisin family serine protease
MNVQWGKTSTLENNKMRTEGKMCRTACLAAVLATAGLAAAGGLKPASIDGKIRDDLGTILRNAEATELIDVNIRMRDGVSRQQINRASALPNKAERHAAVSGLLKQSAQAAQAELLDVLRTGQQEGKVGANLHSLWLVNMVHAQVTPDLAYEIAARADVEFVALDHKAGPDVFPVEPVGGPIESTGNIECGVDLMGAPDVWNILGITGQGVTVCVIDTGCCITHPDLANQIWTNPGEIPGNNIDDDNNGFIDDIHGWSFDNNGSSSNINDTNSHGTHVSGTVGGDGTNGTTTGMAPDVAIMTAKFYNNLSGEVSVWNSMQYAVDNGADVITASLGWAHGWNPDRPFWREI